VRAWTRRHVRADGRRVTMGMHMDVTEAVRLEEIQAQAEATARASREKSSLMALMSHRLRTPLNAVLGFAQLLSQDDAEPLSLRQRERLARIDAAGQELLAMVDDVFELAGLDAGQGPAARVPVPIAQVVAQVAEAVEPLARQRGVALQVQADPALTVATDRRLLSQALRHLVAHGVRRNERGGWVALQAAADADPRWCRLTLTDGGPHLSERQRELLFDGIGSARGAPASGDPLIGLDLVRHVLERLGGRVETLHGEPGGAGFVIRLPLAEPPAQLPARQGLKLLCVEDNPVNLMLVQELVAMRPAMQLLCAVDGLSGLELAAAERPDVVLLDLQLPDIPGSEVLARLRAEPSLADCTVIALSANAMPQDIREARAQGFDDYWTKPIDFDFFLAGLDRLAQAV
jgi:signal transduction histidine kinase/CheY-like chemotaxis protein